MIDNTMSIRRKLANRCSIWKVFIPLFLYLCYYIITHDIGKRTAGQHSHPGHRNAHHAHGGNHSEITTSPKGHSSAHHAKHPLLPKGPKPKLILYWNKYFKSEEFKFGIGQSPFIEHGCEVTSCEVTNDKLRLAEADAVVFHGPQVETIPGVRPPGQKYVYVQKEPWMDMSDRLLPALKSTMNLTMTYRKDSDIHLPYAYIFRNSSTDLTKRRAVHPSGKKSVVWVVSHCDTDSKRELYVKELRKYIDVDIYGECGSHHCSKKNNKACWEMFSKTYNFVLAFESDVCTDYVSEKVYRPFGSDLIPIVYGGANYTEVTPPNSVIDIRRFHNPKHLAHHLKQLMANKREYNSYFKWKHEGFGIERYRRTIIGQGFCELCTILHDEDYVYRDYSDLRRWWVDGSCDRNVMKNMMLKWR